MTATAQDATTLVDHTQLAIAATRIAQHAGMPESDAALLADTLIQAELWGHRSHGLLRLPWYVERLRSGAMRPVTAQQTLLDAGAMQLWDGDHGVGQVLSQRAMEAAVDRAATFGVGLVGVRNSNHFGTAMYFTRQAAERGCAAILTTNASPAMAPWGGREKGIGTNPWSIAAPRAGGVVVLDIANTAVARGKVYLAHEKGQSIPDTWALTVDGRVTTDPAEAIDGVILPMAGHKGYAIAFMMDILSGALTGSSVGRSVVGPYSPTGASGAGHLFIAIDASAMDVDGRYEGLVQQLVDQVHDAPLAHDASEIVYPGELEDRSKRAAEAAGGIPLPHKTRDDLRALADACSVRLPF